MFILVNIRAGYTTSSLCSDIVITLKPSWLTWCIKSAMSVWWKDGRVWFVWEMTFGLLAYIHIHISSRRTQQPRCPLIHCSNWELLAPKSTRNQTWGGSRPLSQLCPLSLMSLNDFNILPCHNLANRCQFSVPTRPIGYLPELWPRNNDDVQFNISFDLYSRASKWRKEKERKKRGVNFEVSEMISWSTSGNEHWHFTY